MIQLDSIAWRAGSFTLENVAFSVPAGRYGVLMGKTGSGKTTVLEIICGLRRAAAGRVRLGGRDVTDLAPGARGIGYVPQDGALFPTMTVRGQLGFALRLRRRPAAEIARRDRPPDGLSGGERQRVALGRALAAKPKVLVLDEPLSALDEERRDDLAALLRRVQRETAVTVLHVTHQRGEAARLADVLFRLEAGRVVEESVSHA